MMSIKKMGSYESLADPNLTPRAAPSGDIAEMIVVAHPERKLEMGHCEDSVKVVAEERSQLYSQLVAVRMPTLRN